MTTNGFATLKLLATAAAALALIIASPSCSSDKGAKPSKKSTPAADADDGGTGGKSGKSSAKSGTTSGGETGSGDTPDPCTEAPLRDDEGPGFELAESTYADIKSIVEDKCISCHTKDGSGTGNYEKFDEVKSAADEILKRVKGEGGLMPPSKALAASEISKIKTWIDDGKKPEPAASGDDGGSDPCGGTTGSETGGETTGGETTGTTTGGTDPEFYELLINPPKLEECHTQSKPLYRDGTDGECDPYTWPANFKCDAEGVKTAFGAANYDQAIAPLVAAGHLFDQCAVKDGKPVIYMMCLHNGDEKCVAKAQLNPDKAALKSTRLKTFQ